MLAGDIDANAAGISLRRPSRVHKCAIFANIMLSSTPKPLNKVELTMELGIEDDTMASSFYLFL